MIKSRYRLKLAMAEMRLPKAIKEFRARATDLARQRHDSWAVLSTQRAPGVAALIEVAEGRTNIVELGTASGWTAAALVLSDPVRTVTTFDPVDRPHRDEYWGLLDPQQRERIVFFDIDGARGADKVAGVDMLFIDSSHDYEPTIAEFKAWAPALAPGAKVVFDDFGHDLYPDVERAVTDLGLDGEVDGGHFVWTAP